MKLGPLNCHPSPAAEEDAENGNDQAAHRNLYIFESHYRRTSTTLASCSLPSRA